MLPDRVSNPGPLTYESGALPIALRGPAVSCTILKFVQGLIEFSVSAKYSIYRYMKTKGGLPPQVLISSIFYQCRARNICMIKAIHQLQQSVQHTACSAMLLELLCLMRQFQRLHNLCISEETADKNPRSSLTQCIPWSDNYRGWVHFQGKQLGHVYFCLPLHRKSTLKEKNKMLP